MRPRRDRPAGWALRAIGLALALAAVVAKISAASQDAGPRIENTTEREDLTLAGRTLTIVKHFSHLAERSDPDSTTLTALEILDAAGHALHRQEFPSPIQDGAFRESCAAGVEPLVGSNGTGLLVSTDCLPSAPLSGGPWQVLALDGDRLVPVGKPIVTEGKLGRFEPGAVNRTRTLTEVRPDALGVRVWTGYFFATVPLRIDWRGKRLALALRCYYQSGHGLVEEGCEFPAAGVERAPADQDLTFVRLFPEARESVGPPAHVVVTRSSTVEILAGKVRVRWSESPDVVSLDADDDDIWFKVRIDGREGWIHTPEDLLALGLQSSG